MTAKYTRLIPQEVVAHPSAFFVERLLENSNLEMDWWWAAGEVTNPLERRYCLMRALAINPDNQSVAAELAALERTLAVTEDEMRLPLRPLFQRLFGAV